MSRDSENQRGQFLKPGGVIADETDLHVVQETPGPAEMVFDPCDHPARGWKAAARRRGVMQPAKKHARLPVDLRFGGGCQRQIPDWLPGQGSDHRGQYPCEISGNSLAAGGS